MSKSKTHRTKKPKASKKSPSRFKPKPHGIKTVGEEETKTASKTGINVPAVVESQVGKSSGLKLITRRGRTSRFAVVIQQMAKLKEGEHVLIPCPKDANGTPNTKSINNMLWVMRRRAGVQPPKGCVFQSRTTEDGNLAVLCVREKEKNKV